MLCVERIEEFQFSRKVAPHWMEPKNLTAIGGQGFQIVTIARLGLGAVFELRLELVVVVQE